jgi:hypothetical protein
MHKIPYEFFFAKNMLSFYSIFVITLLLFFVAFDKPLLAPLVAIVILMFYMYSYYRQEKRFDDTYEWDEVIAKVIRKNRVLANCFSVASTTHKYKKCYKVNIAYKYRYEDKEYQSDKYALSYKGDRDCNYLYDTVDQANKMMYRYTKDSKVKVYVNPENPNESVIMRGKSKLYGFRYDLMLTYSMLYVIQFVYGLVH